MKKDKGEKRFTKGEVYCCLINRIGSDTLVDLRLAEYKGMAKTPIEYEILEFSGVDGERFVWPPTMIRKTSQEERIRFWKAKARYWQDPEIDESELLRDEPMIITSSPEKETRWIIKWENSGS